MFVDTMEDVLYLILNLRLRHTRSFIIHHAVPAYVR
jgi:hypothetical protein